MRLLWSSRSPFARKVAAAVHELGIAGEVAPERVVVTASKPNEAVMADNPLGQIPTLLLPDGGALFDSRVILEWLDQHRGPRLLPAEPAARLRVLRLQALGDGIMDNSIKRLGERMRGPLFSEPHATANAVKIARTLDWLESEAKGITAAHAGSLSVACALAHLDFRHDDLAWRSGRPRLAAWHAAFSERPSMRLTAYSDEY